jgi:hypothetical protein
MPETRELTGESEYIELKPLVVKEHLLRLFNNQIQRDYVVADFVTMDQNIVVKLKRRVQHK